MNSNFSSRHDLTLIDKIRSKFNEEYILNLGVGKQIGSNITLRYFNFENNKGNLIFSILQLIYILFIFDIKLYLTNVLKNISYPKMEPDVILEALINEPRNKSMWFPIAKAFGQNNVLLITENSNVLNCVEDFNIILPYKFDVIDFLMLRIKLISKLYKYIKFLKVDEVFTSSLSVRLQIYGDICTQFTRIIKANYIFSTYKPKSFITSWDGYSFGAAYSASFNNNGVVCVTLLHGAAGRQSIKELKPLNAKYIVAWGKLNTRDLLNNGVDRENILECGVPRMKKYPDVDHNRTKKNISNLGLIKNKKTIGIFFSAYILENFLNTISEILESLKMEYQFLIRFHPSNDDSKNPIYAPYINNNVFILSSMYSLQESIELCEFIIIDYSTSGFDALNSNKAVFMFLHEENLTVQDVMLDAFESNCVLGFTCSNEFIFKINEFRNNLILAKQLKDNQEKFISEYISYYGEEAASKIVEEVYKLIRINSKIYND